MRYRPRKAGGIHQDVELAGPGGDALGESLKAARILQRETGDFVSSGPQSAVCTENLSSGVVVVKSAKDGA
jgi:hypothetical protein